MNMALNEIVNIPMSKSKRSGSIFLKKTSDDGLVSFSVVAKPQWRHLANIPNTPVGEMRLHK